LIGELIEIDSQERGGRADQDLAPVVGIDTQDF
jgi:hypothetical protein